MTRIYVAVAAACFAGSMLIAPAAEACISCEYTPEVVNTPAPKAKKSTATRKEQAKPAKKQAVKRTPPAKTPKTVAAKPPVQTEAPDEKATTAITEASPRSGTATAVFAEREAARAAAATEEPPAEVGCKRYSAEARTTVTVPCE